MARNMETAPGTDDKQYTPSALQTEELAPGTGSIHEIFGGMGRGSRREEYASQETLVVAYAAAQEFDDMEFQVLRMHVETGSVYGAAIAMPQIARSAAYHRTYTVMAIRSFLWLILNLFLQASLLRYIGEAVQVMQPLGGQMHLCDFGNNMDVCPDAPHCLGPGGTRYTSTRLYSYTQWTIQNFVKDAFKDVVPEKMELIDEKVDPGEYGIENSSCRWVVCFLFGMAMLPEIASLWSLAVLIWKLPTNHGSWIEHVPESTSKHTALQLIKFQCAGMPLHWKVFNVFFVFMPKMLMCYLVCSNGFLLLFDTAGILDLVLGAMSLGFILTIDEMVLSVFSLESSRHIMTSLLPYTDEAEEEAKYIHVNSGESHVDHLLSNLRIPTMLETMYLIIPYRFLYVSALVGVFAAKYYCQKCTPVSEGGFFGYFVSKEMHYPDSSYYSLWNLLTGTVHHAKDAFWEMPEEAGS